MINRAKQTLCLLIVYWYLLIYLMNIQCPLGVHEPIKLKVTAARKKHFKKLNAHFASTVCVSFLRFIDLCLRVIMRAMWFCGGFHWIKVKGERAAPSEAPILTVAPHSSYFDAIPVTMTMCSIVTKLESRSIPVWGSE